MDFPILTVNRITESNIPKNFSEVLNYLGKPLIQSGYINASYIDAIEKSLEKNGPYFVLAPDIALPHATATDNVKHLGVSVLRMDESIQIGDLSARLFIFLATSNAEEHLTLLTKMVDIMDTQEKQEHLLRCEIEVLQEIMMSIV